MFFHIIKPANFLRVFFVLCNQLERITMKNLIKSFIPSIFFFVLSPPATHAQKLIINGVLIDSSNATPIPNAVISLFNVQDSTLVAFGISSSKGKFEIVAEPGKSSTFRLLITHVVYKDFVQSINVSNTIRFYLDTLRLSEKQEAFEEIVIKWERPPLRIRGDTFEFNADVFLNRSGAMVEDLMKRIPGMRLENGKLFFNGQAIDKIFVDGREFFGSDPEVAMKNLPSRIVEAVQVFDQKDDFGERTRSDQVSINLVLKKEAKKGHFGKAFAGYGTDKRYESGLMWNLFRDTLQLSIIGFGNNLSQSSFSFSDIYQLGGYSRSGFNVAESRGENNLRLDGASFGGGDGITSSGGGGLNLNHVFKNGFKVGFSFNGDLAATYANRKADAISFFADSSVRNIETTDKFDDEGNASVRLILSWKPDTINYLSIRTRYTGSNAQSRHLETYENFVNQNDKGFLLNNELLSHRFKDDFNNNMYYSRKIKQGMHLNISNWMTLYKTLSNNEYDVRSGFPGLNQAEREIMSRDELRHFNNQFDVGINKKFDEKTNLNLNLGYGYDYKAQNYRVMQNDTLFEGLQTPDLATDFVYQDNSFNSSFSFRTLFKGVDCNVSARYRIDMLKLTATVPMRVDTTLAFQFFLPQISLRKQWQSNRVEYKFSTSNRLPGENEFRPNLVLRNMNSIQTGNLSLQASYTLSHELRSYFELQANKTYFEISFHHNNENNPIIHEVGFLESGVQFVRPVNAKNPQRATSASASINHKKSFAKWIIDPGISISLSQSNRYRIFNRIEYQNTITELEPGFNLSIENDDKIYFEISYSYLAAQTTRGERVEWLVQSLSHELESNIRFKLNRHLGIQADADLYFEQFFSSLINNRFLLLKASIEYSILENNTLQARLSCFDILNQNRYLQRSISVNTEISLQENMVTRYFMLSLVYNLSQFGNKSKDKGFQFW